MTMQQELIPLCMGERLRRERQNRRISIEKVSRDLRIDEPVVKAIEEDALGHLAAVYQRGYISSYANYLKFESSEIDQMLDSINSDHPELHTVFPEAPATNKTDRWLKATSYVMASLLIGTLAWQFTHEAVRLSQEGTDLVAGTISPDLPASSLDSSTQQIEGATHINASIAGKPRQGAGEQAWSALDGIRPGNTLEPAGSSGLFTLDLTTSGDSLVEITDARGQQLELDLVRGGARKRYQGVPPFKIRFGQASAVSLFMEGQAVDLGPYTSENITNMVLHAPEEITRDGDQDPGRG